MKFKAPSRAASSLTIGMFLLVATTIFAQQLSTPRTVHETTAKQVANMVGNYHLSQRRIGDEVSQMLLQGYLKQLDPQKMYFLQSDVDGFNRYKLQLDDMIKMGNIEFAYAAFDRYSQRLNERIQPAQALIDGDHDFTIDEEMQIDPDNLTWAKSEADLNERWRKRIKYELLSLRLDDTDPAESRKRLNKRYRTMWKDRREIDDSEKLEMYLSALTHCFDPHSSYMSPRTLEDFRISMNLRLEGIGAALRIDDGFTIVVQIVPGGAADKDGRLAVGDKIVGVRQETGDYVDVVEMKLKKVVRYIRGKKGTKVFLTVKPAESDEKVEYELTRQTIELKSSAVRGDIIDVDDRIDGVQGRIGILNIPSFYRDFGQASEGVKDFTSTARDVKKVLADFEKAGGVDAVVVDLRLNGGGALTEAIVVSDLFIDHGPVVQVKDQEGNIKHLPNEDGEEPGVAFDGPIVVLCNRLSASASEIFAGVIKDYQRGIIIGDTTTHGKGTVQNVMPVNSRMSSFFQRPDRGALKLTISQFYRVNGDSTQNHGVRSDIVLPSLIDNMDLGESFLDNALAFDHVAPAEYATAGYVTPDIVSTLLQSSAQRVNADEEFLDTLKDIEKYVARKKRKAVSLNEEVLKKERADDKKNKEEDKKKKEEDKKKTDEHGNGPIFPEGSYNNEVLRIALEYAKLLEQEGLRTVNK